MKPRTGNSHGGPRGAWAEPAPVPRPSSISYKRRNDLGGNPDRTSAGLVDDRPLSHGANPHLPVLADEFHVPVEARALGRLADPRPAGHHLAFERGAKIVDLMPHHDPDEVVLMLGRGDAVPMGQRHFLDP